MINLFKKHRRNLPDFWSTYEKSFDKKISNDIKSVRFVVLDTETTGFDYDNDRILCIGAIGLQNNTITIKDSLEVFVHQEHYNIESAKIHGILKKGKIERLSEKEALKQLLEYLGNSILVAHHTKFDVTMINRALERHGLPKLKNKALDTAVLYKKALLTTTLMEKKEQYTLDDLADKFDISKEDRHTAIGDSYITAIAFQKILNRMKYKKEPTLKDLFK
ncbi:MAG: DNA polymerase-3 subunit epsilon [Sediminicola sp.]|jgi:DNA polymerase-3 subunit epsilon